MLFAPCWQQPYPNCGRWSKGGAPVGCMPCSGGMGTCLFPMPKVLADAPALVILFGRSSIPGGRCSQGGVKIPTGGKGDVAQARERLLGLEVSDRKRPAKKGQQIRCDSEADGYSPDERERFAAASHLCAWADVVPYALILVLKEESHESDVART